ncbi:CPBP family intramembrane metalloprotease [Antarcticibacterium arcticum]|uniref:CPBP family intramembrane metalloprotease n=1 Tax=Antarcticibacterium arcticum TaxID=2585771 RepID=A0A5B8YHW7_9FLAO|nr:CPBP family intramembrane glutamic endopeptidase [Antarcticibacterium arcticum]QED37532.1 CPBP family intramembrane metalloprotease [Antarcticibacterium arcticum]
MYIEQAFKYQHEFWRYLLGILIVIAAIIAGQMPFVVAIFMEKGFDTAGMDESELLRVLDSNLTLFLMLLPFAIALLALFFVVRHVHNQPFTSLTTARKKTDWGKFWFAFGLVAIFSIGVTVIDYFTSPEDYVFNFQAVPFLILLVVAVILVPLQTSFEEYFFRGYLMQGLGTLVKNRWLPLIVTSVVFGGLHFFNPEVGKLGNIIMVYYIGTGFLLGIMTLMDEGLELALGFHAGNNLITALLVTADWTAFQTNSILKDVSEPSAGLDILIPVLVVYPIFLLIMAKKYKWTNWGAKLFGKVEEPVMLNPSEES